MRYTLPAIMPGRSFPIHSLRFSLMLATLAMFLVVGFYLFDNHLKDGTVEGSWRRLALTSIELALIGPAVGISVFLIAERQRQRDSAYRLRLEQERERRFQLLGRMAASVTHEIRNPLHNVRLIGEELRRQVPPDCAGLMGRLDANLTRLDHAIMLVYELARPPRPADEADLGIVALLPLVEDAIRDASHRLGGTVPVRHEPPGSEVQVAARESTLRIALDNLVRNALEAAGGLPVDLAYRRSGASWILLIRNPGHMPEEVVGGAIPGHSGKPDGLGVGLSIARHLLGNLGGNVIFRNCAGHVETIITLNAAPEADDA